MSEEVWILAKLGLCNVLMQFLGTRVEHGVEPMDFDGSELAETLRRLDVSLDTLLRSYESLVRSQFKTGAFSPDEARLLAQLIDIALEKQEEAAPRLRAVPPLE